VLLEAMACGKPVVSTELATGTSFVNQHEETGLVVRPNDAAALAEAISYLLAHPEIRQRYGQVGRERVERHFSAEGMVDRILAAYTGGRVPRGTAAKGLPWGIHEAKARSPFDPSSRMATSS